MTNKLRKFVCMKDHLEITYFKFADVSECPLCRVIADKVWQKDAILDMADKIKDFVEHAKHDQRISNFAGQSLIEIIDDGLVAAGLQGNES